MTPIRPENLKHRSATAASTRHRRRASGELFDQGGAQ